MLIALLLNQTEYRILKAWPTLTSLLLKSECMMLIPTSYLMNLHADWDRSAKVLKCGTATYFEDKPTYQRPVQEITSALVSILIKYPFIYF